jgi:PKD repeat protein
MIKTHTQKIVFLLLFSLITNELISQIFTDQTEISLPALSNGSVAWGDYNNDGLPDILIAGVGTDNLMRVKVLRNTGSNYFTDNDIVFSPAIPGDYNYNRINALWSDFDNDGYIDILTTGQLTSGGNFLIIYRNEGNNSFILKTTISFLAMYGSSVDCGDYDNDGDQDILLATENSSEIYQNQGNFVFTEQSSISLGGIVQGPCKWGDYDNDSDLDVICGGALYKNLGNNVFVRQDGISLFYFNRGSSEWGDYNNDGFLDILLTGNSATTIYKNERNGTFTPLKSITYNAVNNGIGKWGDLDNDGDLDIIISGDYTGKDNVRSNITSIYHNNGDDSFTEATGIALDGVTESSVALGDYDNDGDLDILLSGNMGASKISKIYRNDALIINPVPGIPVGLSSEVSDTAMILRWKPVSSDNTDSRAISYNVMAGTTSGASDLVSPNSSASGFRRISGMGNGQLDTTFILKNIKKGTYYWKVQAVDNSFRGGAFSDESSFISSTSYPAYALKVTYTGGKESTLTWSRGNGENCIVFMKEGASGSALPADNNSYTASATFKTGSQIGTSGWYCVYKGIESSIHITGLNANTDYIYQVCEFDGGPGSEVYNIQTLTGNPLPFKTGYFTELKNAGLQPVNTSNFNEQTPSVIWFDSDNDDDLDLLIVGTNASKLYRNDGNDIFTLMPVALSNGYSAACGDYDNDGNIDILIGYSPSRLYRNNGDGTFSDQTSIPLPSTSLGSVGWGDFDNDGDLDIVITGSSSEGKISKIFKNNGNNTFTEQNLITLTGVAVSSSEWGDYDNNGFLDLLISGMTNSGSFITKIYRNDGKNNLIEQSDITLPGTTGVAEWNDYDTDGDLDILLSEMNLASTRIFRNDENNIFNEQAEVSQTSVRYGSADWGDYDNDGDPDLLLTGYTGSLITKIIKNNGNGTFTEDVASSITGVGYSSASWGDYDNDGDLDIALTGNSSDGPVSKIYRNDMTNANPKPAAPTGLTANVNKSDVTLSWNRVRSDNTPFSTISYNIKVGTTTGDIDIVSPHASANGFRRLTAIGNCDLDSAYILKKLPFGTYYWSVQAIDNGLAGGQFSAEGNFTVLPVQAKNLSAKILNNNALQLKWERGNGERCAVFGKELSTGLATPVNNTGYIADNEFGYGEQIGSTGWYCIYNGRADSVNVTGLIFQKEYSFQVIEYMGTFGSEQYFTEIGDGNPGVFTTSLFARQTGILLADEWTNTVAWGDYDNDGFLDLLMPGSPCRIYHNNGDNTFTELSGLPLLNIRNGSARWGDYDNDGDLDFIITGTSTGDFSDPVTKIFRNEGSGTFTEQAQISLTGAYYSSVTWGDYDNDGDLDILLTGATGPDPDFKPVTKIYRNNGDNTFTEQSQISVTGIFRGSAEWGDYDNDGDLDILLTGATDYQYNYTGISKIYRNDGNNTFTEQSRIQLYSYSSSAWIDFDNDGDLDFSITYLSTMLIYENLGDNQFSLFKTIYLSAYQSLCYAAWSDYNNDGFLDILLTNPGLDSKIFKNINGKEFVQQDDESLRSAGYGFASWADYDNDGDPDFILAKGNGSTAVYKNNLVMKSGLFNANASPSKTTGLLSVKSPLGVTLKWSPVKSDETPYKALTYNVRVGTKKDSANICPPHSDSTGFRKIPAMGNGQTDTTFLLKNLPSGNYYWSVQAVDQGFKGGAWSDANSFLVKNTETFFKNDTVCKGLTTSFTDQSVAADGIASWKWDFRDGTTSDLQNPVHTFSTSGEKLVKLLITSLKGDKDSLEQKVIVKPAPSAGFNASTICQGSATTFMNTTVINGLNIAAWTWDYGDGQLYNAMDPSPHGYLSAGDYMVRLKVVADNGCSDSIQKVVTVGRYPVAVITSDKPLAFCKGDSVILSVGYDSNYNYQWMLDSTGITGADSNKLAVKLLSGKYSVEVTNIQGNCVTTSSESVVNAKDMPVKPVIKTDNYEPGKCLGENPVRLRADQSVAEYSYQWLRNGVPLSGSTLTHIDGFLEQGDYTLKAHINGCNSLSDVVSITYIEGPEKPILTARGPSVWYLACSSPSVDPYKWYYNGNIIPGANSNIYIAHQNLGKYNVRVTNEKGCFSLSDTISIPFDITSIEEPEILSEVIIYPNPTTGLFKIEMNNNLFGELIIDIFTHDGSKVLNIKFEKTIEHFQTQIDLSGQSKGMYLINLSLDKFRAVRKVLVE